MKSNAFGYDWRAHLIECEKQEQALFTTGNPEGYQINISHPYIRERYRAFLRWKGISPFYPVPKKNRLEFEDYIKKDKKFIALIRRESNDNTTN